MMRVAAEVVADKLIVGGVEVCALQLTNCGWQIVKWLILSLLPTHSVKSFTDGYKEARFLPYPSLLFTLQRKSYYSLEMFSNNCQRNGANCSTSAAHGSCSSSSSYYHPLHPLGLGMARRFSLSSPSSSCGRSIVHPFFKFLGMFLIVKWVGLGTIFWAGLFALSFHMHRRFMQFIQNHHQRLHHTAVNIHTAAPTDTTSSSPSSENQNDNLSTFIDHILSPTNDSHGTITARINDSKDTYEISLDIPGVPKDKIKLSVKDHVLTVEAERSLRIASKPAAVEVLSSSSSGGSDKKEDGWSDVEDSSAAATIASKGATSSSSPLPEKPHHHQSNTLTTNLKRHFNLPDTVSVAGNGELDVKATLVNGVLSLTFKNRPENVKVISIQ